MSPALEVRVCGGSDPTTDRELELFFGTCPTSVAQQTPDWRDVIAGRGVDEPLFLVCREGARVVGVLPGYRFAGPLGAILCSAVQAGPLGGVACAPGVEPEPVYGALLAAFLDLAAERECALASVLTNPFSPDRALCEAGLAPDFVLENSCQVLDLESGLDADGDFPLASAGLRRSLRRAESAGFEIDDDASEANVAEWTALHEQRQAEIGAPALPRDLVDAARRVMVPADRGRFFFVRAGDSGALLAGGLYLYHGAVIDALMPAVSSAESRRGAGFALAAHSIRWARSRGLRWYNWQASPPEGGVHRFKQQWGSYDLGYAYLTRALADPAPFLESSVEAIRAGYPWHYVLPFDCVGRGAAPAGPSSRASAWKALEEAERSRVSPDLKRSVVAHYEQQLRRHGATARGMDWKDEASQRLRFSVLCEIAPLEGHSVHEIGAGAGHLCDFLKSRGIATDYSGSDLSAAMVDAARERNPGVRFEQRDVLLEPPAERYDVVFCSGVFHVRVERPEAEWREFVHQTLRRMFEMCRLGIAFNLMSTHVDYRSPNLYYADPGETLAFCRRELSPFVTLRHDYPLYEYTTYVYRDDPSR